MIATLTVIRYKRRGALAGLFSMALFRLPLRLNPKVRFWKLLGSGKDGRFGAGPDWGQYGIFTTMTREDWEAAGAGIGTLLHRLYGPTIARWVNSFGASSRTFVLEPIEGHGIWDGKPIFGDWQALNSRGANWAGDTRTSRSSDTNAGGPGGSASAGSSRIAVLTRASVRWTKIRTFRRHIAGVETSLAQAPGLRFSVSIGESPLTRQATFSVWKNKAAMLAFAYGVLQHREVVQKTRAEGWYTEEMFVRFNIVGEYTWEYEEHPGRE